MDSNANQTKKLNLSKQKSNVHVLNNKRCLVYAMVEELPFSITQSWYQYAIYQSPKQQWHSKLQTICNCFLVVFFCLDLSVVFEEFRQFINHIIYKYLAVYLSVVTMGCLMCSIQNKAFYCMIMI